MEEFPSFKVFHLFWAQLFLNGVIGDFFFSYEVKAVPYLRRNLSNTCFISKYSGSIVLLFHRH